ncbi:MAG: ChaN family lipoprotein [Gemmatimonadota bacterium]
MARSTAVVASILLGIPVCRGVVAQTPAALTTELRDQLAGYVVENYNSPEMYVVEKLRDHDVVFLGEWHRIRHDLELIQRLIPLVYEAGVHVLATEFARRADQPLLDSLVAAPDWDEALAREILFRMYVHWGYQEYVDVFRAAWELNRDLPDRAPIFRVVGVNNAPDWSVIESPSDEQNPQVRRQVWHGETEEDWARPILEQVERGEKVLAHMGFHHSFTRYRQPIVVDAEFVRFGDVRAGNWVYEALGDRAFTISLHSPWFSAQGYQAGFVRPADGLIDALFESSPGLRSLRVGFDVVGSPFADLPGETAVYRHGYESFDLATLCDGYIYQGPLESYRGVTPIPDFVNASNLERARLQSPMHRFRRARPVDFLAHARRLADIPRRFAALLRRPAGR